MAEDYKILGQAAPGAATATDLYTVGAGKKAVISTIMVCHRGGASGSFRIAIRQAGAALENKQYIAYDTPISANDSIPITIGITLGVGDVVTVYGSSANFSFSIYGTEIS
jgi:hypothetical protein